MPSLETRFWLRLLRSAFDENECWNWPGATQKGYGAIQRGRRGEGITRAHQLGWTLVKGDIPDGLHVLHKCDNRLCVNPTHLFLGTNADSISKGRKGRKLTAAQAREIKLADGKYRAIGAQYGVSHKMVSMIKQGRLWK